MEAECKQERVSDREQIAIFTANAFQDNLIFSINRNLCSYFEIMKFISKVPDPKRRDASTSWLHSGPCFAAKDSLIALATFFESVTHIYFNMFWCMLSIMMLEVMLKSDLHTLLLMLSIYISPNSILFFEEILFENF